MRFEMKNQFVIITGVVIATSTLPQSYFLCIKAGGAGRQKLNNDFYSVEVRFFAVIILLEFFNLL